jgi:secondary thiamine-phosphate synthase enzyme
MEFSLSTSRREEFIDITRRIEGLLEKSGVKNGLCVVYTPHTTAAITINENADPSVAGDMLASLGDIVKDVGFSHIEGNSPAHVKSSLVGCSVTMLVEDGRLKLGTWQGVYLCEFDGPRTRSVYIKVV